MLKQTRVANPISKEAKLDSGNDPKRKSGTDIDQDSIPNPTKDEKRSGFAFSREKRVTRGSYFSCRGNAPKGCQKGTGEIVKGLRFISQH